MIATLLVLTNKLIDLVKERFIQSENDLSTIDLIEDSLNDNNSVTDSMVVFSNCEHLELSPIDFTTCCDDNNNCRATSGEIWVKRRARRKNRENVGLSSHKKMECDAGASRVSFSGTAMSPRKTPISPRGMLTSPESDCNSNNLNLTSEMSMFSTEKTHDSHEIFQDNSDYQWFLDYGCKDNAHHQSVFSVLNSHDLLYYDDLARDLDANLAEVDMDDFHRADIHSVLSTLPNMCNSDIQGVEEREMFASVSESMMIKFGLDCSSPHSSQQEENTNSMSMCKSELLFSPVRESFVPNGNLSVDSLDLSENDINILITCQANKNNYTIAFEGSTVMGSDDSVCPESGENADNSEEGTSKSSKCDQHSQAGKHNFASNINNSMTRSDSVYTTWSKIKQRSNEHLQLRRQANGNNNTAPEGRNNGRSETAVKSMSLPNLFRQRQKQRLSMSISSRFSSEVSSPVESEQFCIKLYDVQKSNNSDSCDHSTSSAREDTQNRPHNLNLVKLFIKQKSASHEGMCNYASESPMLDSYCEGSECNSHRNSTENSQKKDCVCHLDNNVLPVKTLKNNWIQENRKNLHECSLSGFEDSLVSRNARKSERIQLQENSDSESVEQITESFAALEQLNSNVAEQSSHKIHQREKNSCAFNVNNNNSVLENNKSKYCSDESTQENGSNTESTENITCNCRKTLQSRKKVNLMEKSIQTSKVSETGTKEVKIPAYILYPNYSLPDLEFLKEKHYVQNIDFTKIFLRPQTYGETVKETPKRRNKVSGKRPFSVNDIETLKRTGFKHVRDWDSLTFLLPKEYKEFLQDIPEIVGQLRDAKNKRDDLKPLFSLNAPSKKVKKRPISCDSNFFGTECRSSNYSSTATQPSSGYRGSSTMLNSNNSNSTQSPRNPSSAFRYESNDSVFNSRKSTPPRSGSLLNSTGSDDPPARPPLPRSILRNQSLDNTRYTCKTQKDNANKRYSMFEFGEKNFEMSDIKASRRRSAQDPYNLKSPQRNCREVDPNGARERHGEEFEENCVSFKGSSLESDMRRLEELLEISAVFGENMESFTENDMMKLRSQVSRFLTMQKNLQRVSDCLQTVNENEFATGCKVGEDDYFKEKRLAEVRHSQTPNNTPEHKKKPGIEIGEVYDSDMDASCLKCSGEDCRNPDHWPECQKDEVVGKEDGLRGLKKTVSFAEKISSLMKEKDSMKKNLAPPNSPIVASSQATHKYQAKGLKLVDVPISEESYEGSPTDSPRKSSESSTFLQSKKDLIVDVKNAVEKMTDRSKMADEKKQEDLSNLCLHHLCPSLYAVLSDGLKEEVDTPFGALRNSVWSVIEASSQQGPLTEPLNHLVIRLNRDEILTEGLVKFNAFIFGLLNVNALDAWFSYLRTRDGLLHKHYNNSGLLLLSNSGGAPIRILMDQLIHIIQPLSRIQFGMDIMYQAKLLHCSLQNLNCLLETTDNDFLSPTKQLMLLKLVQSIQNSISQPSDGKRSRQPSEELDKLFDEPKERSQAASRPRPRSGCDILCSDNVSDVAGCVKKRWSGVQLNSKLLQAFERLGEETESEYSDSLDNARGNRGNQSPSVRTALKRLQNSDDTIDEISQTLNETDSSDVNTKEKKKNILSNLNKKTISRLENVKTEAQELDNFSDKNKSGGHKFKRLQQKWEKLSGKSNADYSCGQSSPCQRMSPAHRSRLPTPKHVTPEKTICEPNLSLTSPTTRVSRIPRPVTSPVQTTPTSEKQAGVPKKFSSPAPPSTCNSHEKSRSGVGTTKADSKPRTSAPSRISRVDEAAEPQSEPVRSRAVRPSSLPYRGVGTSSAKKSASNRASSMSLNRKPEKKAQSNQRIVRTLSHRLPSDSGHLSFNEGEKLKVVLEVDDTWLLCCRGTQKGLVPKSAVITVPDHVRY